jgi:acetylornithine deacetylase/succinyl-diaminopimelate desuccinylase-like protein
VTFVAIGVFIATIASTVDGQSRPAWVAPVRSWVSAHQAPVVRDLLEFLAIPNVAADRPNVRRNADHVSAMFRTRGFVTELLETNGNPLVFGELKVAGAQRTVLLYAHYDGQPVEPSGWKQPNPFVPVLRGAAGDIGNAQELTTFDPESRIYARSASDDKAPIVALCAALDALKSSSAGPSSNIKIILDGEEEAGSPSLVPAIGNYRDRLTADLMVILDGPQHNSGRPTIAYGARGIARVDVTVFGPKVGVHSGNYGNWIPNPAQRLAALITSMKADDGRVLVAGFNDGIARLTPEEERMIDDVPDDAAAMLRTFGVAAPEAAYPKLQRALQYPTLNIRGMASAFVGAGARTIIPESATASIDIRLVKETRAAAMIEKLRSHIRSQGYHIVDSAPDDATRAKYSKIARVVPIGEGTEAFRTSLSDPRARALAASIRQAIGEPVYLRTLGGTVPIAPFLDALGFPAVVVPTVNFDNNQHEENENLRLGNLFEAVVTIAAILRM